MVVRVQRALIVKNALVCDEKHDSNCVLLIFSPPTDTWTPTNRQRDCEEAYNVD